MYREVKMIVRTCGEVINDFPIIIGLHQGSNLSSFLLIVVLDEISHSIQGDVSWCMLFGDDIVSVNKIGKGVQAKLNPWKQESESRSLLMNHKYKVCEAKMEKDYWSIMCLRCELKVKG